MYSVKECVNKVAMFEPLLLQVYLGCSKIRCSKIKEEKRIHKVYGYAIVHCTF